MAIQRPFRAQVPDVHFGYARIASATRRSGVPGEPVTSAWNARARPARDRATPGAPHPSTPTAADCSPARPRGRGGAPPGAGAPGRYRWPWASRPPRRWRAWPRACRSSSCAPGRAPRPHAGSPAGTPLPWAAPAGTAGRPRSARPGPGSSAPPRCGSPHPSGWPQPARAARRPGPGRSAASRRPASACSMSAGTSARPTGRRSAAASRQPRLSPTKRGAATRRIPTGRPRPGWAVQ